MPKQYTTAALFIPVAAPAPSSSLTGFLRLPQIIGQDAVTEEQARRNRELAKLRKKNHELGEEDIKLADGPKHPAPAIPAIVPVCKSTWWEGIKSGRYPKPVKLSPRVTCWRVEDIRALIALASECDVIYD